MRELLSLLWRRECYLTSTGGLGDVILDYYTKQPWLSVVHATRYLPKLKIYVRLKTTNRFSADLFTYNPHFAGVYFEDFAEDRWGPSDKPRFEVICRYLRVPPVRMPIFLSVEEERIVHEIVSSGLFVVLHPFAGEDFRAWDTRVDLPRLVDSLISRGLKVVVIGGSHFREAKISAQRAFRDERFDYERTGLHNLVGRGNPRLFLALIEKAAFFIGSSSCYLTASWCVGGKSLAIVPDGKFLPDDNWWGQVIEQKSMIVRFADLSHLELRLDRLFAS